MRRGIKQGPNSFLNLLGNLREVSGDKTNDMYIINEIIDNLKEDDFYLLNKGNMWREFWTGGGISPYQNFMEYTLSDVEKNWKYYYEYLTKPNNWLFPKGLYLIVFEYKIEKDTIKTNLLCPYFTEKELLVDMPIAICIKERNTFEPIYYFKGNPIPERTYKKGENAYYDELVKIISTHCKSTVRTIEGSKYLSNLLSINEMKIQLEKETIQYRADKYIVKNRQIIGIMTKNNLPMSIRPELENKYSDLPKIKWDEIEKRNILSLKKDYDGLKNVKNYIVLQFTNGLEEKKVIGYLDAYGNVFECEKLNSLGSVGIIRTNLFDAERSIEKYVEYEGYDKYKKAIDMRLGLEIIEGMRKGKNEIRPTRLLTEEGNIVGVVLGREVVLPVNSIELVEGKRIIDLPNSELRNWKIDNLNEYIEMANEIKMVSDYKLPIIPIRGIMNNELEYRHIILETGLRMNLTKKEYFNIDTREEGELKINKFSDIYAGYVVNGEVDIFIDERIKKMRKMRYYDMMYKLLRIEFSNLLNKDWMIDVKNFLIKLLSSEILTNLKKRFLIDKFIWKLYRLVIKEVSKPIGEFIYPKVNLEIPPYSQSKCSIENGSIEFKMDDEDKRLIVNRDRYAEIMAEKRKNISKIEEDVIERIYQLWIEFDKDIKKEKPKCMMGIYVEEGDGKYELFYNRLLDEIVMNRQRRYSIMEGVYLKDRTERYEVAEPFEKLITEEDLMDADTLNDLYKRIRQIFTRYMIAIDESQPIERIDITGEYSVEKNICGLEYVGEVSYEVLDIKEVNKNNSSLNSVMMIEEGMEEVWIKYFNRINGDLEECKIKDKRDGIRYEIIGKKKMGE